MNKLRKIRIALAALMFAAMVLLFADCCGMFQPYLSWAAKIQLLPAVLALNVMVVVALLVVTLLIGRVYCSVVCPLGILQDLFSWLGGKAKKNRFHYTKGLSVLRIVVLVVFVLLMVFGLNSIALLIAPYSAFGRMAATLFHSPRTMTAIVVSVITLVVIGTMAFAKGRLWCNTVCPVGTVLGFVSKFALFKPVINVEKCNGCTRCARNCKGQCINPETHTIDYSRCVACMDCLHNCKQGAITLSSKCCKKGGEEKPVDASRRKFVVTTAAVGAAMAVEAQEKKVDGGLAVLADKQLPERKVALKPFGAKSLKHFSSHCTACQLCVSECPEKVLRPSVGLKTLLQPEMGYDKGYCRPDCTRCSEVCPTGAIAKLSVPDKSCISIGHAVTVKENCLLGQGLTCNACSRHCPAAAISIVDDMATGHAVVTVNETRCIGCGACEYYCPVRPFSAIYVEGREVHVKI